MTRVSFKCSVAPENGASKYELVATNDAKCHEYSNWDVIFQDLSGKGFASDEVQAIAAVVHRVRECEHEHDKNVDKKKEAWKKKNQPKRKEWTIAIIRRKTTTEEEQQ